MDNNETNTQGMLVHQVFMVSKEEGARIIERHRATLDAEFIEILEKTNNEKE
jgi:hypothetical protein